jgi:hypothetical protein
VLHGVESRVQDEIAHHVPMMHATIVHKTWRTWKSTANLDRKC